MNRTTSYSRAGSYDLVFWQQRADLTDAPRDTGSALCKGHIVEGLIEFPVEQFLAAVVNGFPGAVREPNGPSSEWIEWTRSDGAGGFEVEWTHQYVAFNDSNVSLRSWG